jgi:hypothetical protein
MFIMRGHVDCFLERSLQEVGLLVAFTAQHFVNIALELNAIFAWNSITLLATVYRNGWKVASSEVAYEIIFRINLASY